MLFTHKYSEGFYTVAAGPNAFAKEGTERYVSLMLNLTFNSTYAIRDGGRLFGKVELRDFLVETYKFSTLTPDLLALDIARAVAQKLQDELDVDGDPRVDLLSKIELELELDDTRTAFVWDHEIDSTDRLLDNAVESYPEDLTWPKLLQIEQARRDMTASGEIVIKSGKLAHVRGAALPWEAPKDAASAAADMTEIGFGGWYNAGIAGAVEALVGSPVGTGPWAAEARHNLRLAHKDLGVPGTYILGNTVFDKVRGKALRPVSADEFTAKGREIGWYMVDGGNAELEVSASATKPRGFIQAPRKKEAEIRARANEASDASHRNAFRDYNTRMAGAHISHASAAIEAASEKMPAKHTGCR